MPDYTFTNLSPLDFETLCRDLLQEELGLRLESFSRGPDQGVDARYSSSLNGDLILQCKHYAGSTFADLKKSVRVEAAKVGRLKPMRYVLATSLRLTPARKATLFDILVPHCRHLGDILGSEDLNNLLGKYPSVERLHHKLWLGSSAVLERVLHSELFAEAAAHREDIQRHIDRFVPNPSLDRALGVLDEHGFVIISGSPGIGKTTLATMIAIDHIADGYDCFPVWRDIAEARKVQSPTARQLFIYDDFLGRTGIMYSTPKNEDEQLLRFLRDVASRDNIRLVLTTREYILNQARWIHEGFGSTGLELARCVIALCDYTRRIRAEILYNHLYYSSIPPAYVHSLLDSAAHRTIVDHENFSPRIVDLMSDALRLRTVAASRYPQLFVQNLDDPRLLWEVAFRSHLTPAAQHLLLVVGSLGDKVPTATLQTAFESFHSLRATRYGISTSPYDFLRGLKELEGDFVRILRPNPRRRDVMLSLRGETIELHNPSVRDFLEHHYRAMPQDVEDLLASATLFDQVFRLDWVLETSQGFNRSPGLRKQAFLDRAMELWSSPSRNGPMFLVSGFSRFGTLALLRGTAEGPGVGRVFEEASSRLLEELSQRHVTRDEIVGALEWMVPGAGVDVPASTYRQLLEAAFSVLEAENMTFEEFEALQVFLEAHPDEVEDTWQLELREAFPVFADWELREVGTEDWASSRIEELEGLAGRLDVALSLDEQLVAEILQRDGMRGEQHEYHRGLGRPAPAVSVEPPTFSDRQLDAMFDSLRQD